jgi:intein-encoded DNA endonuclease-like protein/tRNA1(Val) A37 N6-methylase TrmN6
MIERSVQDKIIELYNDGLSSRKVSDIVGISATQIRRILKNNNIAPHSNSTSKTNEDLIIDMYCNNGKSSENIAKTLNINPSTVCRVLKRRNIEIKSCSHFNRKYKINTEAFKDIKNETQAYFLGLMYADGNVSSSKKSLSITLHNKDIDVLRKFSEFIYGFEKLDEGDKYTTFRVHSSEIYNDLINLGCVPNKTFKINSLPKINEKLIRHFLRGVYDGDGCIYISKSSNVKVILTCSSLFVNIVQKHLQSHNIHSSLRVVKDNVSELTISRIQDSYKILFYLYNDSNIYLDRKYNIYLSAFEILERKQIPSFNYGTSNIISYHGKKLSKQNIVKMTSEEKELASDFVFDYFRRYGFPYPKYTDEQLILDFANLQNTNCTKIVNESYGRNITRISNAGLKIFKHFSPHFFEMKNSKRPSMVSAFNDDEMLKKVIRNRMGISYKETFNITGNMIRQGFKNAHVSFAGSVFKPALVKFVYDNFAPERSTVLDISMGFGQRLLGAMASSKVDKYIGIDPWQCQIEAAKKMTELLGFNSRVEFHQIGSENLNIEQKVDFCFSSPPFFDKEIYVKEDSQAYSNGLDNFINDWWMKTIENVHRIIITDGTLILNMDNYIGKILISKASKYFSHEDTFYVSYQRGHVGKDSLDSFFVLKAK